MYRVFLKVPKRLTCEKTAFTSVSEQTLFQWPLFGWPVIVSQVLKLDTKLFIMFVLGGFFALK